MHRQKGIDHRRVKVGATAFGQDLDGPLVRHAVFVDLVADEGVVHIGQRHDAGGERNLLAPQAFGVAGAVPFFLVAQRQLFGHGQQGRHAPQRFFRPHQRVVPLGGVGAHDGDFVGAEAAGFEQNAVGHADGAHVVHRHATHQLLHVGRRQGVGHSGLGLQSATQDAHIVLHPQQVALGVGVALLGQGRHGKQHHLRGMECVIGGIGGRNGVRWGHADSPEGRGKGARYNHTILPPGARQLAAGVAVVASNSRLTSHAPGRSSARALATARAMLSGRWKR